MLSFFRTHTRPFDEVTDLTRDQLTQAGTARAITASAGQCDARLLSGLQNTLQRCGFVSLIVGAMLMWLDIRPMDILYGIQRFFARIWNLGFDAIHLVLQYVLVGAVIVVPIWLVMRLMSVRSTKS